MELARIFERAAGRQSRVRLLAYDGSKAGPDDADVTIEIRSPMAVKRLVRAPAVLGLARAYIAGDLDISGDPYVALRELSHAQTATLTIGEKIALVREVGVGALVRPVDPPPEEVRLRGRRHSKSRDKAAISHHYDVSNRFYEWVLGPSMAYTCAVFPREDASLEEAQAEKFDLVCRKLGLKAGMRLLDVGCGWGGMVLHAVKNYGVTALGVTLSEQQAGWAQAAIEEAGLRDRAEVRFADYRDVHEDAFDAISSIGLTEHIGRANVPAYFRFLYGKLRPEGRLLNHCITRPTNTEAAFEKEGFINRYVFPDGELEAAGYLISTMQDTGFEVRHAEDLREHYAKTLTAWCRNLDEHWDEAVAEVGPGKARVWALYMAGSRLGFEENHIQLHQVLGVKVAPDGTSGMPLRPAW
jgi:cyclopropane-fatty-acyl-phospholipid synthase